MPLISIIVPVYKVREDYLRQCIKSLINQTYRNIEVILVNDGTPDKEGVICDEYAQRDNRIKVIHQKNQGVSAARNNGMDIATGDWITFVDADDWIELDACEKLKNIVIHEDIDFLIFALKVNYVNSELENKNPFWYEEFVLLDKARKEELQIQLLYKTISKFSPPHNMVGVAVCKLYNINYLRENNFKFKENLPLSEDGVFAFHVLENSNKVLYVNEYLYHYRKHGESATFKYRENAVSDYSIGLKELEKCLSIYDKGKRFYIALYFRTILNISAICNQLYCHKNNKRSFIDKIRGIKTLCESNPYKTAIKEVGLGYYFKNSGYFQKVSFLLIKVQAFTLFYYFSIIVNKYKRAKIK